MFKPPPGDQNSAGALAGSMVPGRSRIAQGEEIQKAQRKEGGESRRGVRRAAWGGGVRRRLRSRHSVTLVQVSVSLLGDRTGEHGRRIWARGSGVDGGGGGGGGA